LKRVLDLGFGFGVTDASISKYLAGEEELGAWERGLVNCRGRGLFVAVGDSGVNLIALVTVFIKNEVSKMLYMQSSDNANMEDHVKLWYK
jgi:hypothetical protein